MEEASRNRTRREEEILDFAKGKRHHKQDLQSKQQGSKEVTESMRISDK